MVMSSVEVCMDSSTKWQPNMMQERGLKPPGEMLSCSQPLLERRPVKQQTDQQVLNCPRCDSTNTKFCYYNNYSLSQPRHFCKTCRRYWTRGGALRNVPVGGGCRKNKRTKRSGMGDIHSGVAPPTSSSGLAPSSTDLAITNPLLHQNQASSMHYGLPSSGNDINLIFARIQQAARLGDRSFMSNFSSNNMGLGQSSMMPPNLVSSLLNNSHSAALKSSFSGFEFPGPINARHDHGNEDYCSFLEANPHITPPHSNLGMFSVPTSADMINNSTDSSIPWTRLNQPPKHPLSLMQEEHHPMSGGHALAPFSCEEHTIEKSKVKVEEPDQNKLVSDWQMVPGASENLFHSGGDTSDYWNGGSWPDLIGSSTSPLV
ncbi:hypothetical protein SUGI_0851560 [Cryptomeria japonica]|uniref:dof zinc finger protein DOF3.6 n=1 Tax=Cryptomeria japonica TaxID=3369 RepID=UPI0024146D7A|nr:dof zinc finger protein DOF3.6 [Cryptomeria japonica]GLJ41109.1 hypothetical protein SUGI_0851560 [Cryptomeria japonica]